tara:strand:+ start:605 stop:1312 length:708 start_codon:yes stop_codon:yes gene_type:complete
MIERGLDQTVELKVYRDGALVAPSAVTVSLYDSSGAAKVDGATATIAASFSTYEITAATTTDLSLGEGWRIEWTATISGSTYIFRNDAALVRRLLYPVVTDADLFRRASSLNPASSTSITSLSNYQDYLDEAWVEINNRLINSGRRPNLIISPYSLRESQLYLTLALIFEDLSTRLNEAYEFRADEYRKAYERSWTEVRALIDSDDSGEADDPQHRENVNPTIWLSSRGGTRWLF